jgi:hypothetical protein
LNEVRNDLDLPTTISTAIVDISKHGIIFYKNIVTEVLI